LNQSRPTTKQIRNLIKWAVIAAILFVISFAVFVYLRLQTGYFGFGPGFGPNECSNPDRPRINGTVTDLITGEPIVHADVVIEGEGLVIYCLDQFTGTIKHNVRTDDEGRFSVRLMFWPSSPLQFSIKAQNCERYAVLKSLRDLEPQSLRDYLVQISLTCQHNSAPIQNRPAFNPN
jgi:hypothetical protein